MGMENPLKWAIEASQQAAVNIGVASSFTLSDRHWRGLVSQKHSETLSRR